MTPISNTALKQDELEIAAYLSNGQKPKKDFKQMSTEIPHLPVDYVESARRHMKDAQILMEAGRQANSGQLLGFSVECGLKALLVACGVPIDAEGSVTDKSKFKKHMPELNNRLIFSGHLIPDGRRSTHYQAMLPNVDKFSDWKVDHRYFRASALPLTSVPQWTLAAQEINEMLDQAMIDGVM